MNKLEINSQPVNVRLYLWGSTVVTLILTSLLSWWLLSEAWSDWSNAQKCILQFENFYKVLQVSNDLASERAFSNELVLSTDKQKYQAGMLLDHSRQKTDRDLTIIPKKLLSTELLGTMYEQLKTARQHIDQYRIMKLEDRDAAQQAIDNMAAATDFYHQALFRHTSEFLDLDPSALGPILRAQALGELRDVSGRLGAQLIIPLATQTPLDLNNLKTLSQEKERIDVLWWIMRTHGDEDIFMPGFSQQLSATRYQFESEGDALINKLIEESENHIPYSFSAKDFAVSYHKSLKSFNMLLDTYLDGVEAHYADVEKRALEHLVTVSAILVVLYLIAIGLIIFIRNRMLKPIMYLNQIVNDILTGKKLASGMINSSAEELHTLFTSLGTLDCKLREQIALSEILKRQSEEDPLTQLFNRRAFESRAGYLLNQASHVRPLWLLMLDVDHFKQINDTWGHSTGDEVLLQLAKILKKYSRPEDVIGRLGGEEFAIAFCAKSHKDVMAYSIRIQNEIRKHKFQGPEGASFSVTASFGMASGWGLELRYILEQADTALYDAKRNGRDRICGETI
ncbi:GGDEF domain-containing protein [Klebsiella aerogenes]